MIDNTEEVLSLLRGLKTEGRDRAVNGEVFTPIEIIEDMLDRLDASYMGIYGKSIFTEGGFKWGDVMGCGCGQFSVMVYKRLMEGLSSLYLDKEERSRHIIREMLFMAELNPKNVGICRGIFGAGANIWEGDVMDLHIGEVWGIDRFDVILGNPPYNSEGIRSSRKKQTKSSKTIWPSIIKRAFQWLRPDGFLMAVHPLSWLRKSHPVHYDILNRHVLWLSIWDSYYALPKMGADVHVSFYLVHNKVNTDRLPTHVHTILKHRSINETNDIYLDPYISIPLYGHSIINKIYSFITKYGLQMDIRSTALSDSMIIEDQCALPTEYTLEDKWACYTYRIRDGLQVCRTSRAHVDAAKKKIITCCKASLTGAFIDDGRLGITGNHNYYILDDGLHPLENLLPVLGYRFINLVIMATRYQQDFIDRMAWDYIPDTRKLGAISEEALYEMMGLTPDEIAKLK